MYVNISEGHRAKHRDCANARNASRPQRSKRHNHATHTKPWLPAKPLRRPGPQRRARRTTAVGRLASVFEDKTSTRTPYPPGYQTWRCKGTRWRGRSPSSIPEFAPTTCRGAPATSGPSSAALHPGGLGPDTPPAAPDARTHQPRHHDPVCAATVQALRLALPAAPPSAAGTSHNSSGETGMTKTRQEPGHRIRR